MTWQQRAWRWIGRELMAGAMFCFVRSGATFTFIPSVTNPKKSARRNCQSCRRPMIECARYCAWCGSVERGLIGTADAGTSTGTPEEPS